MTPTESARLEALRKLCRKGKLSDDEAEELSALFQLENKRDCNHADERNWRDVLGRVECRVCGGFVGYRK